MLNQRRERPSGANAGRTRRTLSLLQILIPRSFRVRYRQSALDLAWAIITPVVFLIVYGIVLTKAFNATGTCAPYLSSAWAGLVIWTFFSSAYGTASWSLIDSGDLMSKIYFPRESLPLAEVGVTTIDLGIGLVTIFVVAAVQGVSFGITVVALVPVLVMLLIWTCALSIWTACLTVFIRDVGHAVQLVLRAGFFASPVMYETSQLPESLQWTSAVNPIAAAIDGTRAAVLCGTWPRWGVLGIQLVAGTIALIGAVWYTSRIEDRFVDVL